MKRSLLLSILLNLIFVFFIFLPTINAAELSQSWFCFDAKRCDESGANCSGQGGLSQSHRVRLTLKKNNKPLPNHDTYIIECLQTEQGQICTSGNPTIDQQLFKSKISETLNNTIGYIFQGLFKEDGVTPLLTAASVESGYPPKSSASQSLSPLEWQSYTPPPGTGRRFFGLNLFEVKDTPAGTGGQQQKPVVFEEVDKDKNCAVIRWDPTGRVFDSQSLEPIEGAQLTLLKKTESGLFDKFIDPLGVVQNPVVSTASGEFSFVVPDGFYRLSVSYNGFTFPFSPGSLEQNWKKIYADLYYASGSGQYKSQDIEQKGKIVHIDVPLDPQGTSYSSPVADIGHSTTLNKGNNKLTIEGRVTHPLTKIKIYSKKPDPLNPATFISSQILATTTADSMGWYKATVDQKALVAPEVCCQVIFEKADLTADLSFFKKLNKLFLVQAQTPQTGIDLEPIPNYLEGYAYDLQGNIMPKALVEVFLTFSKKPYHTTVADETGYFKISSENLPFMTYELKFSSPSGSMATVSTSEFIKANSQTLSQNKVNLYTYQTVEEPLVSPTVQPTSTITFIPSKIGVITSTPASSANPLAGNLMAYMTIIFILVGLIGAVAALLIYYLLKKPKT